MKEDSASELMHQPKANELKASEAELSDQPRPQFEIRNCPKCGDDMTRRFGSPFRCDCEMDEKTQKLAFDIWIAIEHKRDEIEELQTAFWNL